MVLVLKYIIILWNISNELISIYLWSHVVNFTWISGKHLKGVLI